MKNDGLTARTAQLQEVRVLIACWKCTQLQSNTLLPSPYNGPPSPIRNREIWFVGSPRALRSAKSLVINCQ